MTTETMMRALDDMAGGWLPGGDLQAMAQAALQRIEELENEARSLGHDVDKAMVDEEKAWLLVEDFKVEVTKLRQRIDDLEKEVAELEEDSGRLAKGVK